MRCSLRLNRQTHSHCYKVQSGAWHEKQTQTQCCFWISKRMQTHLPCVHCPDLTIKLRLSRISENARCLLWLFVSTEDPASMLTVLHIRIRLYILNIPIRPFCEGMSHDATKLMTYEYYLSAMPDDANEANGRCKTSWKCNLTPAQHSSVDIHTHLLFKASHTKHSSSTVAQRLSYFLKPSAHGYCF